MIPYVFIGIYDTLEEVHNFWGEWGQVGLPIQEQKVL